MSSIKLKLNRIYVKMKNRFVAKGIPVMSTICKQCGSANDPLRQYCYACGSALKPKRSFHWRGFFRGMRANGLAGFNLRGINLFPLGTAGLTDIKGDVVDHRSDAPIVPLADKSWYCPFCGTHNEPYKTMCKGCGREV